MDALFFFPALYEAYNAVQTGVLHHNVSEFTRTGLCIQFAHHLRFYPHGARVYDPGAKCRYRGVMAINKNIAVQDVDYEQLKACLMQDKQILSQPKKAL